MPVNFNFGGTKTRGRKMEKKKKKKGRFNKLLLKKRQCLIMSGLGWALSLLTQWYRIQKAGMACYEVIREESTAQNLGTI